MRGKFADKILDDLEKEGKISRQGQGGGAQVGNQTAKKLTTSELKEEAYNQYCAHLARGKSKRSWYFEHPELTLTWETMEKYIKEEHEFDPNKKKIAMSRGFGLWEDVVEQSANGKNTRANTATLQMLMRNKFGWDKNGTNPELDDSAANSQFEAVAAQITAAQSAFKIDESKINDATQS